MDTFKIKIEKCPENGKNERKHVSLRHARIRPVHIHSLIMKPSRPRPAAFFIPTYNIFKKIYYRPT